MRLAVPLIRACERLSRRVHNRLWPATDESLCSHAWRARERSPAARAWVALWDALLGPGHCAEAFRHWHPAPVQESP